MLEAHIEIEDKLAAKGFKRAMRNKAIAELAHYYATNLVIVWIIIAIADGIFGAGHLIFPHLLFIIGLCVAATILGYFDWVKRIDQTKGWSFHAKLDEQGVITDISQETRYNWNYYKNYKEYEDYLQIESSEGTFTFVPKTPELSEMIEFTKQKIPRK